MNTLTPQTDSVIMLTDPFEAHPRTTLLPEDQFLLTQGPYLLSESGRKSRFGENGRFFYLGHKKMPDGSVVLLARRPGDVRATHIIWSRPAAADAGLGNIIHRPYRIKKL